MGIAKPSLLKSLKVDGAGVPFFCSISLRELKTILPLVNFKVSSAKFLKDKFLVSFIVTRGYWCLSCEATVCL